MNLPYQEILAQSSIIDASAGTGKTYSMVKIFESLIREEILFNPEKISGILFLTFTNAAIEELKFRLWQSVFECYQSETEVEAKNLWMRVLLEFSSLRVQTIQSFLNSCISSLDPTSYMREAAVPGNQPPISQNIIFLRKAQEVFLSLIGGKNITGPLAEISHEQVQFLITMSEFSQTTSWDKFFELAYREADSQKGDNNVQNAFPIKRLLDKYQSIHFLDGTFLEFPEFSMPLLGKKLFQEKEYEMSEAFEKLQTSGLREDLENMVVREGASSEVKKVLELLQEIASIPHIYAKALKLVSFKESKIDTILKTKKNRQVDFDPLRRAIRSLSIFRYQVFIHIVRCVGKDMTQEHPENYGFIGATQLANRLAFQNRYNPQKNLPYYTHVFIDEFQDTNVLEWETMKLLLYRKPHSPRFFLVGDPKQLIYQFRTSDALTYKKAKEEILREGGKQYELGYSYRATPTLVRIFQQIFGSDLYWGKNYPQIVSQVPEDHASESLEILQLDDIQAKKEGGVEQISSYFVKDIVHRRAKYPKRSFAVLARTNGELMFLSEKLREAKIPYIYRRNEEIFASLAAKNLRLLLYATLPSAQFSDSLLVSRGPFFNFPENMSPTDVLDKVNTQTAIYREFLSKSWSSWRVHILEYSPLKNRVNTFEYSEYTKILDLLVQEMSTTSGEILDAIRYLEYMDTLIMKNRGEEGGIAPFMEEGGSVELLTIHKSKGLEFDEVYYLASPKYSKNDKNNKPVPLPYIVRTLEQDVYGIRFVLEDLEEQYKSTQEQERQNEEKNLIYVALTRAKKRLVLPFLSADTERTFLSRVLAQVFPLSHSQDMQSDYPGIRISGLEQFSDIQKEQTHVEFSQNLHKDEAYRLILELKNPFWEMISYTSLAREGKTLSETSIFSEFIEEVPEYHRPIFLPQGRHTGIFLHALLEGLDSLFLFHNGKRYSYVKSMMKQFSLADIPVEALKNMLSDDIALGAQYQLRRKYLKDSTLRFFFLGMKEKLQQYQEEFVESEDMSGFFEKEYTDLLERILSTVLPNQKVSIGELFQGVGEKEWTAHFRIPGHKWTQYVESTVDFIFLGSDEKFYFLDWKTDTLPSYSLDALKTNTNKEYSIQWKLYMIAVVRFLEMFLENFQYEKHFGGFYYFYVRGIAGETRGIDFHGAPTIEEYREVQKEVGSWQVDENE